MLMADQPPPSLPASQQHRSNFAYGAAPNAAAAPPPAPPVASAPPAQPLTGPQGPPAMGPNGAPMVITLAPGQAIPTGYKACSKCKAIKLAASNFWKDPTKKNGYTSWCKQCFNKCAEKRKAEGPMHVTERECSICHLRKPADAFMKDSRRITGLDARCRECRRAQHAARKQRNIEQGLQMWEQKECKRCHIVKPAAMFKKHAYTASGLDSWCKACCSERRKELLAQKALQHVGHPAANDLQECITCLHVKPSADFAKDRAQANGLAKKCKGCEKQVRQQQADVAAGLTPHALQQQQMMQHQQMLQQHQAQQQALMTQHLAQQQAYPNMMGAHNGMLAPSNSQAVAASGLSPSSIKGAQHTYYPRSKAPPSSPMHPSCSATAQQQQLMMQQQMMMGGGYGAPRVSGTGSMMPSSNSAMMPPMPPSAANGNNNGMHMGSSAAATDYMIAGLLNGGSNGSNTAGAAAAAAMGMRGSSAGHSSSHLPTLPPHGNSGSLFTALGGQSSLDALAAAGMYNPHQLQPHPSTPPSGSSPPSGASAFTRHLQQQQQQAGWGVVSTHGNNNGAANNNSNTLLPPPAPLSANTTPTSSMAAATTQMLLQHSQSQLMQQQQYSVSAPLPTLHPSQLQQQQQGGRRADNNVHALWSNALLGSPTGGPPPAVSPELQELLRFNHPATAGNRQGGNGGFAGSMAGLNSTSSGHHMTGNHHHNNNSSSVFAVGKPTAGNAPLGMSHSHHFGGNNNVHHAGNNNGNMMSGGGASAPVGSGSQGSAHLLSSAGPSGGVSDRAASAFVTGVDPNLMAELVGGMRQESVLGFMNPSYLEELLQGVGAGGNGGAGAPGANNNNNNNNNSNAAAMQQQMAMHGGLAAVAPRMGGRRLESLLGLGGGGMMAADASRMHTDSLGSLRNESLRNLMDATRGESLYGFMSSAQRINTLLGTGGGGVGPGSGNGLHTPMRMDSPYMPQHNDGAQNGNGNEAGGMNAAATAAAAAEAASAGRAVASRLSQVTRAQQLQQQMGAGGVHVKIEQDEKHVVVKAGSPQPADSHHTTGAVAGSPHGHDSAGLGKTSLPLNNPSNTNTNDATPTNTNTGTPTLTSSTGDEELHEDDDTLAVAGRLMSTEHPASAAPMAPPPQQAANPHKRSAVVASMNVAAGPLPKVLPLSLPPSMQQPMSRSESLFSGVDLEGAMSLAVAELTPSVAATIGALETASQVVAAQAARQGRA